MPRLGLLVPLALALAACQHLSPAPGGRAGVAGERFLRAADPAAVPRLFQPAALDAFGIRKSPVFTRDGRQLFWSVDRGRFLAVLMTSTWEDGKWTEPRPLPFSQGAFFDHNPAVSADGRTLVFASNRPIAGKPATTIAGTPVPTSDLFVSRRLRAGWSEPEPLGPAFNTPYDDDTPVLSARGSLFFSSARPGAPGPGGIYLARAAAAGWSDPALLPVVNTAAGEMVTGVAPDDSYLLFYSMRQGTAAGLYVSFAQGARAWSQPVSLSGDVQALHAYAASVTPDGRTVLLTAPVESLARIYELDAASIRSLRPRPAER